MEIPVSKQYLRLYEPVTTRGIVFVYLFFSSQFRLVNYFDSEIVRSLSAYFGKTRSEIGYWFRLMTTRVL